MLQSHETSARAIDTDEIICETGPDERDEVVRALNGLKRPQELLTVVAADFGSTIVSIRRTDVARL
jgi:hypothetical protein